MKVGDWLIGAMPLLIWFESYLSGLWLIVFLIHGLASSWRTTKVLELSLVCWFGTLLFTPLIFHYQLFFALIFLVLGKSKIGVFGLKHSRGFIMYFPLVVTVVVCFRPSAQISYFFLLTFLFLKFQSQISRYMYLGYVGFIADYCGSRTVTLAVVLVFFYLQFRAGKAKTLYTYSVFFALILSTVFIILNNTPYDLVHQFNGRYLVWLISLLSFLANGSWLLGNNTILISELSDSVLNDNLLNPERWYFLHNDFLSVVALKGVIGLLLLLRLFKKRVIDISNIVEKNLLFLVGITVMFFDNFTLYPYILLTYFILFSIEKSTH